MDDPLFDLDVNTTQPVRASSSCCGARTPTRRVVFTSTRQIFGKPRYLPVDEDHPVAPVDVNGITKYATEQLHLLYHDVYGLRSTAVRLTNVFGPRQRLRDDLQGFLPIFMRRALADETDHACSATASRSATASTSTTSSSACCSPRPRPTRRRDLQRRQRRAPRRCGAIADAVVAAAGSGRVEHVPWPPDRDAIDIGSYFGDSSKAKRDARLGAAHVVRRRHRAHASRSTAHARRGTCDGDGRPEPARSRRRPRPPRGGARARALRRGRRACVRSGAYLLGPETRGVRGRARRVRRPSSRRRRVASGTDALRLALVGARRRSRRRGDRARVHRRAHGRGRVRDRRGARASPTSTADTAAIDPDAAPRRGHRPDARRDPGAPLRAAGARCPTSALPVRRGRRAGARRARPRARLGRRGVQLLPDEEPRRDRRRRRGRHRRRRAGGDARGCCASTATPSDYVHTLRLARTSRLSEVEAAALRVGLPRARRRERATARDRGPLPGRGAGPARGRPTTRATCTTCASPGSPDA